MRKRNFSPLIPLSIGEVVDGLLLGYIVWNVVGSQWTTFQRCWSTLPKPCCCFDMVWDIFWGCIPMIVVIAIFDLDTSGTIRVKLMMSRQELKDEMKNTDGNPEVKAQQRKRAQQRLQATINKKVPTADVVVVNPTHFAVALRYEKSEADAPVVVAKGSTFGASYSPVGRPASQSWRTLLGSRSLLSNQRGHQIHPDFYAAVAEVLAMIYRHRQQRCHCKL